MTLVNGADFCQPDTAQFSQLALSPPPDFDLDMAAKHFKAWEHHKEESITGYRDKAFSSPCTGTMAPVHHTPWAEAMDDSMKTFLESR